MTTETTKTVNTLKAHSALNVKNVDAGIEFYKNMPGLVPGKVKEPGRQSRRELLS